MATNPLSSLSYTNKDFNTIYVELLDIVKELSSKWDPSISNESDPGVILLKADAIIADKNNYNIDKNVLEMYPETVTQDINARNLYKQLAYDMPWYQSATTSLTFKWVGDDLVEGDTLTIPKYTMLTNEDGTVVYTTTQETVIDYDHQLVTCEALEGTFQTLSINGSKTITLVNLDSDNRVYLPEATVSQNGVFISNIDHPTQWERVDNLQVHPKGNFYYEFGVDSRNSVCYLEFPVDADELIGSGIEISYLVSQGVSGNVSAGNIDRFYSDISVTIGSESVVLNSDVVTVYNPSATRDGSDPQSIADAYRSYRRTAGTFNTLVTLRDYMNAIYNSGLVSNAIVSDRTTDIQHSYVIKTEDVVNPMIIQQATNNDDVISYFKDTVTTVGESGWFTHSLTDHTMVEHTVTSADVAAGNKYYRFYNSNSAMNAFDLKLYLFHTPKLINSNDAYNSTFELESPNGVVETSVRNYLYDQQCIQHDFKSIVRNLPCLFINSFPIGIKVVPQHYLTSVQIDQVKRNIISSLWTVCNSRAIEFGDAPDYDIIYDTIANCDERIKTIILDEFTYTTFATYWDDSAADGEGLFKTIPISNTKSKLIINCNEADLAAYTKFTNDWTKSNLLAAYFICEGGVVKRYDDTAKSFTTYSTLRKEIQTDIIVKSVLAGCTPMFKDDSKFEYQINHQYIDEVSTERITTALVISPFANSDKDFTEETFSVGDAEVSVNVPSTEDNTDLTSSYMLKSNESVRFLAPSFESDYTYSNYTKFELILNKPTGTSYTPEEWSENVANNTLFKVDATDYNQTVYDYISQGLVVLNSVDVGQNAVQILVDNGARCLCAARLDGPVEAVSSGNIDNSCLWIPENDYTRFKNVHTKGYLTLRTKSTCTIEESGETDSYGNTLYDVSEPILDSDYDIITRKYDEAATTYKTAIDDSEITTGRLTHYTSNWTLHKMSLTTSIFYNELVKGKDQYYMKITPSIVTVTARSSDEITAAEYDLEIAQNTLNALINNGYPETDTNVKNARDAVAKAEEALKEVVLPQYNASTGKQVIYWLTANVATGVEPDDKTYTDLSKLYVFTDSTDNKQNLIFSPVDEGKGDSSYHIKGMYQGNKKWLPFQYEKERLKLSLTDDAQDNEDYKGTAAIVHKAWENDTLTLYTEETLYTVPANCDYQLKDGDAIVFFWRTDDSADDAPYNYKKYVGIDASTADSTNQSPIIRPSFVLKGTSRSSAPINPDALNDAGVLSVGDSMYNTVFGMYGDNDLSGSKAIETRKLKQVVFDNNKNNYYFITNRVINGEYSMTLVSQQDADVIKPSSTNPSTAAVYRYILQADEYFVRTNKSYTEYEIYYPGTMIGIDVEYKSDSYIADHCDENGNEVIPPTELLLTVKCVPYEEITKEGIVAFSEYCKSLPFNKSMYIREQQVHNVVEHNILMVKKLYDTTTPSLVFTSWKDTYINADYEISYISSNGETITLPQINIQADKYAWTGRACLNLNTSATEPQVITPFDSTKQSTQAIAIPVHNELIRYPEDLQSSDDIYIQSDVFVNRVGGNNIDISYVNLFADRAPVNLYLYTIDGAFSDSNSPFRIRAEDNKILCNLSKVNKTKEVTLRLPLKKNNSYMLSFELQCANSKISAQATGVTDKGIVALNSSVSPSSGKIYYVFEASDDTVDIKFSLDDTYTYSETDLIIFDALFRYVDNDIFEDRYDISTEDILERVSELDFDNRFKYNNRVTSEDERYIDDPLDSVSFFNTNHIMNSYTISKAELQLSKGNDSYITIVNNR